LQYVYDLPVHSATNDIDFGIIVDVRMALRYTHATDAAKRRAVENLVKPIGPSDESVTNEKGRVAALP